MFETRSKPSSATQIFSSQNQLYFAKFAKIFLESSRINLSLACGLKWLSMRFLQRHELYFENVFNLKQALFFEDGTSSLQFENLHAESVEKNTPKCI